MIFEFLGVWEADSGDSRANLEAMTGPREATAGEARRLGARASLVYRICEGLTVVINGGFPLFSFDGLVG